MNNGNYMKIKVNYIDSEKEFKSNKKEWSTTSNDTIISRKIIDRKTFYIYRLHENGIVLNIVDGLKTNPPILCSLDVPFLVDPTTYDYMIPAGIISSWHHNSINIIGELTYNGTCLILTKRNDEKAIEAFKHTIDNIIRSLENERNEINKKIRKYKYLKGRS